MTGKRLHHKSSGFGIIKAARRKIAGGEMTPADGKSGQALLAVAGDGRDDMLHHLGNLVDGVTTGIISLDGGGRIRVFNAAVEKIFGLPRVMVIGRHMNEIGRMMGFHEHSRRALWERLSDAVWAAGAALDLEYDLTLKNGQRKVMSYSVYPIGRMAWSVGNGVVIMLEDITRKKEMEDQISDARKRLLAVFDGITDGIQVVDADFRITAVNKSMTTLLARDIKLGAHCFEACSFGIRICEDCPAEETFRSGAPASITKKILQTNPDGNEDRFVEISTFPLLDRANRVNQVVEYIKDVTERVRLAERLEQSRRLAELGEMAARVAHEVRNPLNAIIGAAHFLSQEHGGDDTVHNFTALIKRQANRVNQVASDLLYVSKPPRAQLTSMCVNAVIDQSVEGLCELIRDQHINVITNLSRDLPLIRADELQIEQAVQNIIRNAIEAMSHGGSLWITTELTAGGASVEIAIQDTGQGIPEQDRERVFQSFFTTKIKGTGLGLTIVQRVLKHHGGEIRMEHPKTGGTRVVLRLPVTHDFNGLGSHDDRRHEQTGHIHGEQDSSRNSCPLRPTQ
ncbi:MAG TPA: ATP-binding protein [Nitrospirota bacterium]|nr:ATP-binding protein [Nitrospirota bacterium]